MNLQHAKNNPGTFQQMRATATKFDVKQGDFGPYALGTLKDELGDEEKVLFAVKKGETLVDACCAMELGIWAIRYDANTGKFKAYYNGSVAKQLQNGQQAPSQPAQSTNYQQPTPQGKKEPDWDAKDLRMARMNSLTNSTKLICLIAEAHKDIDVMGKDREGLVNLVTQTADIILHYIYNGLTKKQAPNQSSQNEPVKAQFCDKCKNLKEECTCGPAY